MKGAPERIIAICATQHGEENGLEPLDAATWNARAQAIAADGQRVLAIATRNADTDKQALNFEDVERDLTLLGLVGLIDPPREEAVAAVDECRAAGIRVKMITGDHAGTASAIARSLGLQNASDVLTGTEIDGFGPAELSTAAARVDVYARTSPEHKLRFVGALQEAGRRWR